MSTNTLKLVGAIFELCPHRITPSYTTLIHSTSTSLGCQLNLKTEMGVVLSKTEQEGDKFRKESRRRAEKLGFLPNEDVSNHPFNKRHASSHDPRGTSQIQEWNSDRETRRSKVFDPNNTSLVVDILHCPPHTHFILVECEGKTVRFPQASQSIPSLPISQSFLADSLNIAAFQLQSETAQNLLKCKEKVCIKISWGKTETVVSTLDVSLEYAGSSVLQEAKLISNTGGGGVTFGAELVESNKVPTFGDFLPYNQWPPMVLFCDKTRTEIMMEEETVEETQFEGELGSSLLSYTPSTLPKLLGLFADDKSKDFFLSLGIALGAPLVDRTNTLNVAKYSITQTIDENNVYLEEKFLKVASKYPVPAFDKQYFDNELNLNKNNSNENIAAESLANILKNRAEEIIEYAKNNQKTKIKLLWSGGIDSTSMVIAFKQHIDNNKKLKDLVQVCYCSRSKEEYPWFFTNVIATQMTSSLIPGHVRDLLYDSTSLVVSGDPADMMFGTFVMSSCLLDPSTKKKYNPIYMQLEGPWHLFADYLIYRELLTREAKPYWISWIKPFLVKSPIPVETIFDFLWWCSFGLKYQHDINRIFYNNRFSSVPTEVLMRVIPFYDSNSFSQWSYAFHKNKMRDKMVWASYKWPLKNFIFKYTGDREYYSAKQKVQSCYPPFGFEHGLDSKFNLLRWGKYSISAKHMNTKFPNNVLEKMYVGRRSVRLDLEQRLGVRLYRRRGVKEMVEGSSFDGTLLYWMYWTQVYSNLHRKLPFKKLGLPEIKFI